MKIEAAASVVVMVAVLTACGTDTDTESADAGADFGGSGDSDFVPVEIPEVTRRPTVVGPNVEELAAGAAISVDGSGFEVAGVATYAAGDVVVSLDGAGFARRVVAVVERADTTRYATEQAALTDIFEELTVSGSIGLSDAGAVDVGSDAQKSHIPGGVGLELTVPFSRTLLDDPGLGVLELSGEASVAAGFQYGWDIGLFRVNLFYFVPWFEASVSAAFEGDLSVVFDNSAHELLRQEFAPIDIPVGAPFPLRIVPVLSVSTVLDGTITGETAIYTALGLEAEGGAAYFADSGWVFPAAASRYATLDVQGSIEADITIVPIRARMEFLVYGASGIFVEADIPSIDVDGALTVSPASGSLTAVARFRLGGGFVPGVFDRVIPQWSNDHIYDSDPYTIADLDLGDGGDRGDTPGSVTGTLNCAYERDFAPEGLVDSPYSDSYTITLYLDESGFTHVPIHDVYGRPYHIVARSASGDEQTFSTTVGSLATDVAYTLEYGATDPSSGGVRVMQTWTGGQQAEADATFFWSREGDTWSVRFDSEYVESREGSRYLTQSTVCVADFR